MVARGPALRVLASPASCEPDGNPYQRLLHDAVSRRGPRIAEFTRSRLLRRPDVVHVHWPEYLVRRDRGRWAGRVEAVEVLSLLALSRLTGARLVWTAHNLDGRERSSGPAEAWFMTRFVSQVDLVISLSGAGCAELRARHPAVRDIPAVVVEHGHYRDAYPPAPSRAAARASLDLDPAAVVFLTLGQIRGYKNITGLAGAFATGHREGERLVVAGEVLEPGVARSLAELASTCPDLWLELSRVASADIPVWHAACDVVVLAYHAGSVLNSGAAILALSFDRPVVVTDSPTMRELRDLVGHDWVLLCDGTPDGALATARRAAEQLRQRGAGAGHPDLTLLDWDRLAVATIAAYEQVLPPRRRRPAGSTGLVGPTGPVGRAVGRRGGGGVGQRANTRYLNDP